MARTVRYRSKIGVAGWPLLVISQGPDDSAQEVRGHARGIIAIGDIATGVIAIGGLARGFIAVGGLAIGVVTVAGVGLGAFVIAGVAIAQTAFGGVAIGQYAKGGVAVGSSVISAQHTDEPAISWFSRLGLHQPTARRPSP